MSRNPNLHSYVPYTGKSYIFYNGVPLDTQFQCTSSLEHPVRTIIQTPGEVSAESSREYSAKTNNSYELYQKNCNYARNNFNM